ncbi:MAG: sigma 54-interacting transcriptional regulator [Sandaracinaceae bacterium]|nr:sigma 54-interacting transcriptional regulator [Sandaracinaceae bacterium]
MRGAAGCEGALAEARYAAGDHAGAEALAARLEAAADPGLALEARHTRGKVALALGELDRAEAIVASVLARAEASGRARLACQALNNLAIVAMNRAELARAAELLERMRELADAGGAVYLRGIAHKNLAVVDQLRGEWQDALRHSERALSLLAGIGNASLTARLAFNTADLYRSLGDPYRALRLCAHARRPGAGALDDAVRCEGLRVEAAIHAELDQRTEAARAWARARALADQLGHEGAADEARLGLATLAIDEGDAARARGLLSGVTGAARSPRTALRVALVEARLAAGGGRVPLARIALDAAERTADPLLGQLARLELARALAEAGSPERASTELAALRRRDVELSARVPPALRELFAERSVLRAARALERTLAGAAVDAAPEATRADGAMIGDGAPMRALRAFIDRVGPTDSTVLITGESGTGKELVAEALHAASSRAGRPFVRVNCAALVETLLTSELFGHERGAFTGADRQKKGRFELADGGTILLDEIGDVSPAMQAALLRVLQERTFERVGGTRTLRVDVRVIAATHRDLAERVAAGLFREDLYYRLSGITVRVPALRERRGDLPALTRHLLARIAKESGAEPKVLSPDAIERLARHPWPGNVRELENVLRSASVLGAGRVLRAADFESLRGGPPSSAPPPGDTSIGALMYERLRGGASIYALRKRLERDLVERALADADGNISRAADLLGMKRPRLSKLVHEWGLKK